jgi:hypothetical protein
VSKTLKTGFNSFLDGFVGSFVLASAIVMAVVGVASAFVNGTLQAKSSQGRDSSSH